MSLTAAQLESLDANGFAAFDSLLSARSVNELRGVYDRILAHDIAAEGDRWLGGVTRQVMLPSKAHTLFADNGCMHFVPGRHREPLLQHYVVSGAENYEGRLLGIVAPESALDLTTAVACALPAGGATVHLACTPHYTPPNRSVDRPRRAYIINYMHPALLNRGRSAISV